MTGIYVQGYIPGTTLRGFVREAFLFLRENINVLFVLYSGKVTNIILKQICFRQVFTVHEAEDDHLARCDKCITIMLRLI